MVFMLPVKCWNTAGKIPMVKGLCIHESTVTCVICIHLPCLQPKSHHKLSLNLQFFRHFEQGSKTLQHLEVCWVLVQTNYPYFIMATVLEAHCWARKEPRSRTSNNLSSLSRITNDGPNVKQAPDPTSELLTAVSRKPDHHHGKAELGI